MLKRILGTSPYEVSLEGSTLIVPYKKTTINLVFKSKTEYDLPLSCSLRISSSIEVDMCEFDVILPAEGKTEQRIVFNVPDNWKFVGGEMVVELEMIDRVLDSKTVYELVLFGEMAYRCSASMADAFTASDDAVYTRNGRFFGNKGELVSLEIPAMEDKETELSLIYGQISGFADGQKIALSQGLNRLVFEMRDDASFEFVNPSSTQTMSLQTLNPKFFI